MPNIIYPYRPYMKHPFRLFPQLNDTPPVFLRRSKMQMTHLRNRMPYRIIISPLRHLSAMQMRHRNLIKQGSCHCG